MTAPFAERIMADPTRNCLKVRLSAVNAAHPLYEGNPLRLRLGVTSESLLKVLLRDFCQHSLCELVLSRGKGCDASAKITFANASIDCIFWARNYPSETEIAMILTVNKRLLGRRRTPAEAPEIETVRQAVSEVLAKDFMVNPTWMTRKEFESQDS
jgi:hypothetical protein